MLWSIQQWVIFIFGEQFALFVFSLKQCLSLLWVYSVLHLNLHLNNVCPYVWNMSPVSVCLHFSVSLSLCLKSISYQSLSSYQCLFGLMLEVCLSLVSVFIIRVCLSLMFEVHLYVDLSFILIWVNKRVHLHSYSNDVCLIVFECTVCFISIFI